MHTIGNKLKIAARTAQVFFPGLLETKWAVRRAINRSLRRLSDPELAIVRHIPSGAPGVFIDVGANRGQTVDSLLILRPDAVIHAFEANPGLAVKLHQLFGNAKNISIHAMGLSDKTEERDLYIPYYRRFMFDGLASFDERAAREWLAEGRIIAFKPQELRIERARCSTVTLDSLGLRPLSMKLDVQEHEIHVLRGGEATLRRHEPILMIEAPRDDLETALVPVMRAVASMRARCSS